tara:strand:+ start:6283 stop:6729 length:447 start_codon:yes stop_codon:yes gene_type:complete
MSMIRSPFKDSFKYFYALLSIIAIGLIILMITRVQRGLSAVILSLLAIVLFFYWSNEIRLTLKKQPGLGILRSSKKFTYEFIKTNDGQDIIAQIPGQHSDLKVSFILGKLTITSDSGISEKIKISKNLRLEKYNFKNGTLTINLLYNA